MKNVVLRSGNITGNGNLSGYTMNGTRVHVPAKQLESAGIEDDKISFPIYAVVSERTFDVLGEDEQPTGETFTRLQAGAIFLNKKEMIEASVEEASLDIEINSEIKRVATSAGFTDEQLTALLTASALV